MRALLLAAGYGKRLRPVTDSTAKCLVPIGGKPLLEYWMETLAAHGVTEILINLHAFPEQVRNYLSRSPFRDIVTTTYEEHLLGTAGTVLRNRDFFRDESFMVIHADNLSRFDMSAFLEKHNSRPAHCIMTMMTFDTPTPRSCGIVEIDSLGVVQAFHEKVSSPPGTLANGAVYIVEGDVFPFLESLGREVIDFSTEVLPHFMGRINTFHNDVYHRDIGTVSSYRQAQEDFPLSDAESSREAK